MKKEQKELAIKLRKEGLSIREITKHVGVSKGSVSLWVKDIKLTPEQKDILYENEKNNRIEFAKRSHSNLFGNSYVRDKFIGVRKRYQDEGRIKAIKKEWLHTVGCMLYWAEGSKNRNMVQIANSDPFLLKLFVKFLIEIFEIPAEKIIVSINVHLNNGLEKEQIEEYWLGVLNLPLSSLRKTILNNYSHFSQRKKIGKLPYGTCRVVVCRTDIVQRIYGAIQEFGEFNREEWLF